MDDPVTFDWRAAARDEYREKRADLERKVGAATKAEKRAAERRAELEQELRDLDAGARAFGIDLLVSDGQGGMVAIEVKAHAEAPESNSREIILTALMEAGPQGLRAKKLKSIIERHLGRSIHYKTPGMTLYRLAGEGLVNRTGYDWFITPQGIEAVVGVPSLFPSQEPSQDGVDHDPEPDWDYEQHMEDQMMDRK
jgi:hypothetical protein